MTEFMSDVDSFDQDSITPRFDSNSSPTLPFAKDLHDTGSKDASSSLKKAVNFGPFFVVILSKGASLMPVSCRPSAMAK